MKPRSVYVIGGAGAGKSTFMGQLLAGVPFGPLTDLWERHNGKSLVTLRGHTLPGKGLYIGRMRDEFPGTDALERTSTKVAAEWLQDAPVLPDWIVAEGLNMTTEEFLTTLHAHTDLLVVYLYLDDFTKDLRMHARGSGQKWSFVKGTATRSANRALEVQKAGARVLGLDSADPVQWERAQEECRKHLRLPRN